MNIRILKEVANLINTFKKIEYIGRIDDNLIKLRIDDIVFYINLEKSKSNIFCTREAMLGIKDYKSPFDFALQKYCLKSNIESCIIDGNNRILELSLSKKLSYKTIKSTLILEFTGKYTNAIIIDMDDIIIEALHKLTQNMRVIKVGERFNRLPQQKFHKDFDFKGDILEYLYHSYDMQEKLYLEKQRSTLLLSLNKKRQKLLSLLSKLPSIESLKKDSIDGYEIGNLLLSGVNFNIKNGIIFINDYANNLLKFEINQSILSRILNNQINFNSKKVSDVSRIVGRLADEVFKISKKLISKSKNISLQENNIKSSIDFLERKIEFIKNTNNINDIKIINNTKSQIHKQNKRNNYESLFINDIKISFGRNSKENIMLLKDARANDIWMHIKDIPSSHLIIHCTKTSIREEIINKAAEILVNFSKFKSGNYLVDYARRRYVKLQNGSNVVYSNYKTILIKKM